MVQHGTMYLALQRYRHINLSVSLIGDKAG